MSTLAQQTASENVTKQMAFFSVAPKTNSEVDGVVGRHGGEGGKGGYNKTTK